MSDDKADPPANGFELAKALGVEHNEGVQIALFPDKVEKVALTGDSHGWDPGVQAWGLIGHLGPWGDRLLDVVTEPEVDVKWWKVVEFARANGYDHVPIRWAGAIIDIPARYFEEGTILGVRLYNHGPWFWPLERPLVTEEADPEDGLVENTVDQLNRMKGYT
jgi:hypothetical protein